MKKYLALLLAVMLVFSCALPAVSAVTPSDNVELTEDTSSEPEGFADPSSEPTPVNPCAHENKEFVEAQEPTCTDTGNVAYYHCPDCDSNLDENDNVLETVELPTAPMCLQVKCIMPTTLLVAAAIKPITIFAYTVTAL